jgi:ceramide glucosyltransferase
VTLPMSWVTSILEVLLLVPCLMAIWYYCSAIFSALELFSQPTTIDATFQPPITILKPICGVDRDAYANLASFCRQDYPQFQMICGVCDEHDPGIAVVRQLIKDFPAVYIRLVVSDRRIGTNPKVSNLANMASEARYSILLISDSDIRVGPNYLRHVVQPMGDPSVGLVTCMYRSRARGLAATLEAIGVSTAFHGGVLVARKLEGIKFALGSTMVIKREALEVVGGFAVLADYLADDFLLGNLAVRGGYRVVLSDYVVEHVLATESFVELVRRQLRWARGDRASRPWGHLGLIFTHGIVMSLVFLLATKGSMVGWSMLSVTWLARLAMAWVIGVRYLHDQAAKKFLWLVPLRDLIGFALWCCSFVGRTIDWRGQRFRICPGGKLMPLEPAPPRTYAGPA